FRSRSWRRPTEQEVEVRQAQRGRALGRAQRGGRDGEGRQQRPPCARARRVPEEPPAVAGGFGHGLEGAPPPCRKTISPRRGPPGRACPMSEDILATTRSSIHCRPS